MPRIDLLALTPDDLIALTNRGTVKRAQKELEEGTLTATLDLQGDDLTCTWSDGIVCRFPAGKSIHDAVCSSGSIGISRHIVRSVLYYQHASAGAPSAAVEPADDETADEGAPQCARAPVAVLSDWDPGQITDDQLVAHFRAATVSRARQRFEKGVLVELVRGPKPLARILDESCTLRFLVPGDVRYVTADCSEALLGTFVPMAVWAFRELAPDKKSGLVALQQTASEVPSAVLDAVEALLVELCCDGLQGIASTWTQRLIREEGHCREKGLIWPAELLSDLQQQAEMYAASDAIFDPLSLVRLPGEWLARAGAIRSGTAAIPQQFIRGSRSDRTTDLASSRLVGLGCGVRLTRRAVTITAYLQDVDVGGVLGYDRTFVDPAPESGEAPRDFETLARTVISRGISIAAIGGGQLLIKSGKRSPGGRLILPRTASSLSLNPQAFAWEYLRAPLVVENFAELAARLELLPPSSLQPRRLTEALHVCPVERIENVQFDPARQRLFGTLVDSAEAAALLSHPFTNRGAAGFENLAAALSNPDLRPRFVCGHVSRRRTGIVIDPICVVFESSNGARRGISPWTDPRSQDGVTAEANFVGAESSASPLAAVLHELAFELSELMLNGLRRAGNIEASRWESLATQLARVGLVRLGDRVRTLAHQLAERSDHANWSPGEAAATLLNLLMLARLADDLPPD